MATRLERLAFVITANTEKLVTGIAKASKVINDLGDKAAKKAAAELAKVERAAAAVQVAAEKLARQGATAAAKALNETERAAKRAAVELAKTEKAAASANKAAERLAKQGAAAMAKALNETAKAARQAAAQTTAAFASMDAGVRQRIDSVAGSVLSLRTAIVALGTGAAARSVVNFTADFEEGLARVDTLLGDSTVSIERYKEQLVELGGRSSKGLLDTTKGLYDLIGGGIPAVEGAAGAFSVLDQAQRAAVAGVSSVEESTNAFITVINAYQGAAGSAAEISDKFFQTIFRGRTTFPELAAQLGDVATNAATFGVKFDELLAGISTLTKFGVSTAESVTALNQLILKIVAPTDDAAAAFKALGIETGSLAIKKKGLAGVLKEVEAALDGDVDAFTKLFPEVRSLRAATVLAGKGMQSFEADLVAIANSTGSTDKAFEKLSNTFNFVVGVLKNRLAIAAADLGDRILPKLQVVLRDLVGFLEENKKEIAEGFEKLFDVLVSLGRFVASNGKNILAFFLVFKGTQLFAGAINGVVALIDKLKALAVTSAAVAASGEGVGTTFATGFGKGAGKITTILGNLLKSPSLLALAATVGIAIGTILGDAIGRDLTRAITEEGERAEREAKRIEDELQRRARAAGASSVKEFTEARQSFGRGDVVDVGGKGQVADFKSPEDALRADPLKAQQVFDARLRDLKAAQAQAIADAQNAAGKVLSLHRVAMDSAPGSVLRAALEQAEFDAQRANAVFGRATAAEQKLREGINKAKAEFEAARAKAEEEDKAANKPTGAAGNNDAAERRKRAAEELAQFERENEKLAIDAINAKLGAEEARFRTRQVMLEAEQDLEAEQLQFRRASEDEIDRAAIAGAQRRIALQRDEVELAQRLGEEQVKQIEQRSLAEQREAIDRIEALQKVFGVNSKEAEAAERELTERLRSIDRAAAAERITRTQQTEQAVVDIKAKSADDQAKIDAAARALAQRESDRKLAALFSPKPKAGLSILPADTNLGGGVSGGVPEAVASTVSAIGESLIPLAEKAGRGFLSVLEVGVGALVDVFVAPLQAGLDKAASILQQPFDTLFGSLDDAVGILTDTEQGAGGAAKKAEALIDKAADKSIEIATRLTEALPGVVTVFLDKLIEAVPVLIEKTFQAAAALLQTVAPKIGPLFISVIDALVDNLPVLVDALVDAIPVIIDGLLKAVTKLVERLPEIVTTLVDGLVEMLPGLFRAIAQNIGPLIAAVAQAIPQIITTLLEALPVILEEVLAGVGDIIGGIVDSLPQIIGGVIAALPDLFVALIALLPRLVYALAVGLGRAVANIFDAPAEKLGEVFGEVGQKIIDSIVAAFDLIIDALAAAAEATGDFLSDTLGISAAKKLFSGDFDDLGASDIPIIGGFFHQGGMVRGGGRNYGGAVQSLLAGAQGYAAGGLVGPARQAVRAALGAAFSDDVPAVLQAGEGVLSRVGMAAAGGPAALDAMNRGQPAPGGGGPMSAKIIARDGALENILALLIEGVVVEADRPGSGLRATLDNNPGGPAFGSRYVRGRT